MSGDSIYALSSGPPPAAIAVVRISGPHADHALAMLAGKQPAPRQATLLTLRLPGGGEILDQAIVLRFPGPASATGEDLVELHLHGGRAVVSGVVEALGGIDGLRPAQPGEFTRRGFENGRFDLAEAEGLADLLLAETQSQRRAALMLAGGALGRQIERWQRDLLSLSAEVEAILDHGDEEDIEPALSPAFHHTLKALQDELTHFLSRAPAERLRDGIRVAIAGPPNSGKSSLLNRLIGREAAITSPTPGTTRDLIEAPVSLSGVPIVFIDTAGLRAAVDAVERTGIKRAQEALASADIVLWLGDALVSPEKAVLVASKLDLRDHGSSSATTFDVSSVSGEGIPELVAEIADRARAILPGESEVALNARQRACVNDALKALADTSPGDPLIVAELLRQARVALDQITGRASVEQVLDELFSRFCIGK